MTPEVFKVTKIYEFDDVSPESILVDHRFRYNTITVQPLNLVDPPAELDSDLLTFDNSVLTGVTGTVGFTATPPSSYIQYDIPDSTIDLATPAFLNVNVPIFNLFPTFSGITGCTHVAITITGFIS